MTLLGFKFMVFGTRKEISNDITLKICKTNIFETNLLGVVMDHNLSWKHIDIKVKVTINSG